MNDTKEIVDDMRRITVLTGEISSLHEANLKNWPFVVFDGVLSSEVKYDLSKDYVKETGESYVSFYIELDPMAENKMLKERCEAITAWVRDMFWKEIQIKVFFNDVNQYEDSSKLKE